MPNRSPKVRLTTSSQMLPCSRSKHACSILKSLQASHDRIYACAGNLSEWRVKQLQEELTSLQERQAEYLQIR
jgi:hypothetical protein